MTRISVLLFISLIILMLSSMSFGANQTIVNVTIEGVPCPFCVNVLTTNLGKLPDVESVKVNEDTHQFIVLIKEGKKPDLALIKKTIKNSGYIPLKTDISSLLKTNKAHVEIKNQPCGMCHAK